MPGLRHPPAAMISGSAAPAVVRSCAAPIRVEWPLMFPAASALSPMHLAILLNVLATSALVIGFVPTEPSRLMARKTGPFLIFIARRHSSRAIRASRARWRSWMTPPLVRRVTVRPSGPFEETSAVLSAALQQRNNQTHGVWTLGAADQARRPLRRCSAPRQCEPEATAERCQRACARSGSVIVLGCLIVGTAQSGWHERRNF